VIAHEAKGLSSSLAEREAYLANLSGRVNDGVLVVTCNRVEWYAGSGAPPPGVTRHLFRTVAGLESALVGETAIQGQIKDAYEEARRARPLSAGLHRLFQRALMVGKRVRTETGISRGAMSHSKAVLEILRRDDCSVTRSRILVIGVNNVSRQLVRYLVEKGSKTVYIANRTYAKAAAVSRQYGGTAVRFDQLQEKLSASDIVISATSAPHLIVKKEQFQARQPLVIFDLAVPRDIDPRIGELPNVTLFDCEDVERRVADNLHRRSEEISKAVSIIEDEVRGFYDA
jgi:glutamyl-tRNA reductase